MPFNETAQPFEYRINGRHLFSYVLDQYYNGWSSTRVAKPLPGGKKVPAEGFSFALQTFFENCILYVLFSNLQNLIVNYTAIGTGIALDSV